MMPAGQSRETFLLPRLTKFTGSLGGMALGRRITHVLLALICPVAIGFEAAVTAPGLSMCTASPPSAQPGTA